MTNPEKKVLDDVNADLYEMVRCASESHRQVKLCSYKKWGVNGFPREETSFMHTLTNTEPHTNLTHWFLSDSSAHAESYQARNEND